MNKITVIKKENNSITRYNLDLVANFCNGRSFAEKNNIKLLDLVEIGESRYNNYYLTYSDYNNNPVYYFLFKFEDVENVDDHLLDLNIRDKLPYNYFYIDNLNDYYYEITDKNYKITGSISISFTININTKDMPYEISSIINNSLYYKYKTSCECENFNLIYIFRNNNLTKNPPIKYIVANKLNILDYLYLLDIDYIFRHIGDIFNCRLKRFTDDIIISQHIFNNFYSKENFHILYIYIINKIWKYNFFEYYHPVYSEIRSHFNINNYYHYNFFSDNLLIMSNREKKSKFCDMKKIKMLEQTEQDTNKITNKIWKNNFSYLISLHNVDKDLNNREYINYIKNLNDKYIKTS